MLFPGTQLWSLHHHRGRPQDRHPGQSSRQQWAQPRWPRSWRVVVVRMARAIMAVVVGVARMAGVGAGEQTRSMLHGTGK